MFVIVTGCAGFIGSHITEKLLEQGHQVLGVDCFIDYYPRKVKENNLKHFINHENFIFIQKHIEDITSKGLLFNNLQQVDTIFHLAAQAGVRGSWGDEFRQYTVHTFEATQKILEVARKLNVKKFIYASSSSVYGNYPTMPMQEDSGSDLWPVSPYGVTKLAGEKLCKLYFETYGLPTAVLRYFTIYGPRQRPDMGFMKFIDSILNGKEIKVYGDGNQTRDFTFITDAVEATLAAASANLKYETINVAGGARVTVNDVLKILEGISGKPANKVHIEKQQGDVQHTYADITKAKRLLNYNPKVNLAQGLKAQFDWYVNEYLKI
ncbi:MAG TPA: NAD-dependent epimerase/dehydratase family protein [Nanoarchaeota archaeon]|nr:NAD-dependent epimerase/dehydratase family protein [Nanoarchaeota archaeon]